MSKLRNKYRLGDKTYNYDPALLMDTYLRICNYTDDEFLNNLGKILHYSAFMSFVLKLDNKETLSDEGIIHQLIHLLNENTKSYTNLADVREKFEDLFGSVPVSFKFDNKYSEL